MIERLEITAALDKKKKKPRSLVMLGEIQSVKSIILPMFHPVSRWRPDAEHGDAAPDADVQYERDACPTSPCFGRGIRDDGGGGREPCRGGGASDRRD